jgi:hypothetical protein
MSVLRLILVYGWYVIRHICTYLFILACIGQGLWKHNVPAAIGWTCCLVAYAGWQGALLQNQRMQDQQQLHDWMAKHSNGDTTT